MDGRRDANAAAHIPSHLKGVIQPTRVLIVECDGK